MNNLDTTYKTSNGLTMVKSKPLNWRKEHIYHNNTGPFFYNIYVGDMAEGYFCSYTEEEKVLTISYGMYSSNDPNLKFKVNSIEEAGDIVKKFAEGMAFDLSDTIYYE